MMGQTTIEWTSSPDRQGVVRPGFTTNFWHGCSKASAACEHCYAEALDKRFKGPKSPRHWGDDAPRLLRVEKAREEAFRLQRRAVREGRKIRVFTNSMSDFFEDRRDLDAARLEALDVIRLTPNLTWMILTKRPGKILELLKRAEADAPGSGFSDWLRDWIHGKPPTNVWIGTTVESQEWADKRIPELLKVPAAVRFLSVEPMLGPVNLRSFLPPMGGRGWMSKYRPVNYDGNSLIHWIICGGESGPKARPIHPNWARDLRDQCKVAGVPFFFKQLGEFTPALTVDGTFVRPLDERFSTRATGRDCHLWGDGHASVRVGKKAAGRLLDGVEHNASPTL